MDLSQIRDEVSIFDEYMRVLSKRLCFKHAASMMVKMYRSLHVVGISLSRN